ncbi:DNA topoisomerase IV, B subunit [Mycoplasmopsis arginini]|nr:DNA topoisomerase IV%2C B subunit [Chlamydia trachomatis]SGA02183.1 DNA topoisomerase IV, B subunit [Chlamydia abortus]SGA07115.1 DNA topoisomerase IV, B subunit [Mycoplasmopsis arginini]CRH46996.1 DNA topoisomerase IV%2C B subunit [Chlamydia trachomatis]CRH55356.1 DNA topoisomerase IV%2C B subunit [Chlamydia trachomatis]
MNPKTRSIIKVNIDHQGLTERNITTFMSDDSEARKA